MSWLAEPQNGIRNPSICLKWSLSMTTLAPSFERCQPSIRITFSLQVSVDALSKFFERIRLDLPLEAQQRRRSRQRCAHTLVQKLRQLLTLPGDDSSASSGNVTSLLKKPRTCTYHFPGHCNHTSSTRNALILLSPWRPPQGANTCRLYIACSHLVRANGSRRLLGTFLFFESVKCRTEEIQWMFLFMSPSDC